MQIDKKTIHKETTKEREKSSLKATSNSLKTFLKKDDNKNNDKKAKTKDFQGKIIHLKETALPLAL